MSKGKIMSCAFHHDQKGGLEKVDSKKHFFFPFSRKILAGGQQFLAGGDPPSLNHPAPDTKFRVPSLGATLHHFFSRHVASYRFTSPFLAMFSAFSRFLTNFSGFWLRKWRVWEVMFR